MLGHIFWLDVVSGMVRSRLLLRQRVEDKNNHCLNVLKLSIVIIAQRLLINNVLDDLTLQQFDLPKPFLNVLLKVDCACPDKHPAQENVYLSAHSVELFPHSRDSIIIGHQLLFKLFFFKPLCNRVLRN